MLKPTRQRRDESRPHRTRVLLVETTARAISERGTVDVELDAVLDEVGVTKGSLYHHFENANALIVEAALQLFRKNVDEAIAAYRSVVDECSNLDEVRARLAAITRASQLPDRARARLLRAHLLSLGPANDELGASMAAEQRRQTDAITECIRIAQQRGWFRRDLDPHALAVFTQSYTLGRVIDDASDHQMDPDAWTALLDRVIEGFFVAD